MTDDAFTAMALEEAEAAAARGEVPAGAALWVSAGGALLARDGNRIIERREPTVHARMLVLSEGARSVDRKVQT